MVNVLTPLGGLADVLGIIGSVSGIFPARPPQNVVNVRVAVGINGGNEGGGPLMGAEGGISRVKVYNNNNEQLIGNVGDGFIGSGQFRDFRISQPNNQQAAWASIAGDGDPICVFYATTQWVDGSRYGWSGDWGHACGWEWYYGNVYVDNSNYRPRCAWITTNHAGGMQVGMYKLHWPSFVDSRPHGNSGWSSCRYSCAYRDPFKRSVDGNGTEIDLATVRRNQTDSRLIVSDNPDQSARELCESATSWGPDFVSLHEGLYCNLSTSKLMPLCKDHGGAGEEECFDLTGGRNVHVRKRQDGTVHVVTVKDFGDVLRWDLKGPQAAVESPAVAPQVEIEDEEQLEKRTDRCE